MEDDGLPNQVCLQCVHYINRAFSFKQLCERSDATLRQYLGKNIFSDINSKDVLPQLVQVQILNTETNEENTVSQLFVPLAPIQHDIKNNDKLITPKIEDLDMDINNGNFYKTKIQIYFIQIFSLVSDSDNFEEEIIPEPKVEEKKSNDKKKKYLDETEQPIYPCEDCTQCFTTLVDLRVHSRTHPKNARNTCRICNQEFASASTLCRHMKVNYSMVLIFFYLKINILGP